MECAYFSETNNEIAVQHIFKKILYDLLTVFCKALMNQQIMCLPFKNTKLRKAVKLQTRILRNTV